MPASIDISPAVSTVLSRRFILRPLSLIIASLVAPAAWAQSSPYNIGVSQGFTHQTNLFGATRSSGARVADKYSSTGLFGGVDLKLSRQRVFANAVVRANRYEDVKLLNNDSHGLNAGLDWETIGNLSGGLRVAANRSLASYTTAGAPPLTNEKNIESSHQTGATVRKGFTSRVALTAGLQRREVEFSAPSFSSGELKESEASIGLRYGLPGQLVFGVGLRKTQTDRPRALQSPPGSGIYIADEADRDDLDLTAEWSPSGLSTLSARLSFGREEHSLASLAGFEGTTGAVSWVYRPSDKTTFNASFTRDTGTASSFATYEGTAEPLEVYSNTLTNVLQAGMNYAATAKIRLNGNLRHSKGKTSSLTTVTSADDTVNAVSLGATYAFSRSVSFNCGVSHEKRETGTDEISARTVTCAGQLTLR